MADSLNILQNEIAACRLCPRLRDYTAEVARVKRRAWLAREYWGKPVPSFGDPAARVLILGLAPGAHGSNRTGRMFTGDRSGDILYRVLYGTGFASQPASTSRDDGLELRGAYITAACHCAPPGNKPLPAEIRNCRPYLERELELLRERALTAAHPLDPSAQVDVRRGRPADALLDLCADVDLLVVGSRRWGPVARVLLGSTGESLAYHATCPILIVPRAPDR